MSALRTAHLWVYKCTTVVHNTAQNSSHNFPSYPLDVIIVQIGQERAENQLFETKSCFDTTTDYTLLHNNSFNLVILDNASNKLKTNM